MHDKLLQFIGSDFNFNSDEIEAIKQCFEPVSYSKNTLLEEAGKIPGYLYYIVSGYLRLFYLDENGNEVTTHINCPPGFFTSYTHFINQTRSEDNVECITNCDLLRITKENLDQLVSNSQSMKDFSISVFQQSITYNENRSKELSVFNAEQRYLKLIDHYPEIIQNVPIQYIASFLGMKPESLSRIRKKIIN
ncbi:cyclic nucleotide-binding protein [Chryseobacterium shigense]|uniref:cAMP-binding domain of CRP or a regulatory subunit of cAMP-dependent protein kinases n=1 Tax=Chryseobacterium shigense TaxID=297244 RepID=A0A1N7ILX0_9FLAO|nr:Crp/Fnr family transcriptional regulator [Chryseobacterium shigense]PQA95779.1 cyclic nucleotide-binding protein [Chryseobacterium shigense]SIS38093.1 cAMP-binding domain of CRP or a regulatory subunit of cAMP-dependent protein kinases [Chryseobacterium shigense]